MQYFSSVPLRNHCRICFCGTYAAGSEHLPQGPSFSGSQSELAGSSYYWITGQHKCHRSRPIRSFSLPLFSLLSPHFFFSCVTVSHYSTSLPFSCVFIQLGRVTRPQGCQCGLAREVNGVREASPAHPQPALSPLVSSFVSNEPSVNSIDAQLDKFIEVIYVLCKQPTNSFSTSAFFLHNLCTLRFFWKLKRENSSIRNKYHYQPIVKLNSRGLIMFIFSFIYNSLILDYEAAHV